jgi:hypothetical protein
MKSERHLLFLAENNVLQVSGGSQVQSAGEKVQGNLSE